MATSYFPGEWEIYVENPGYGEVMIRAPHGMGFEATWRGEQLGRALVEVTTLALTEVALPMLEERRRLLPQWFTTGMAHQVLPALQRAVVQAAAGTDRYERVFTETDEKPAEPLCVHCNHGTYSSSEETRSAWCEEYGHAAFGFDPDLSWEGAQESHRHAVDGWEFRQRMTAIRAPLPGPGHFPPPRAV